VSINCASFMAYGNTKNRGLLIVLFTRTSRWALQLLVFIAPVGIDRVLVWPDHSPKSEKAETRFESFCTLGSKLCLILFAARVSGICVKPAKALPKSQTS